MSPKRIILVLCIHGSTAVLAEERRVHATAAEATVCVYAPELFGPGRA